VASLQARAARLLARVSTKFPIERAVGTPHLVRRYRTTLDRMALSFGRLPRGTRVRAAENGSVRGEWIELATQAPPSKGRLVYYLHGGAFVGCSARLYRSLTGALALRCSAAVFALDYRLAPEHPFPAALDDAIAGYEGLLARGIRAGSIVVGGDSAGGGLALSLLLALRDRGRPLPAAGLLFSPWVDLAATGPSIAQNARIDDVVVYDDSHALARMYAGQRALDDPAVSGLYADLTGLPPLLVQASEIEMLRDDAVRLASKAGKAGVDARLRLFDGVHHVWQLFTALPESREALDDVANFVDEIVRDT
jgi:acetyl esterase/lipase